jgi:aminoglycoside phosphotransferase (APT) family kinase protein
MAIINRIEPAEAERSLSRWLATKLDSAEEVTVSDVVIPASNGRSSETLLFEAAWLEGGERRVEPLVARVEPVGERVVYTYDLDAEFLVQDVVSRTTDIPAPQVRFIEHDASILGATFIVMERLEGRTPGDDPPFTADADGWFLALSPEERGRLFDNALRVLAKIQAVDWSAAGLESLERTEMGDDPFDQQLEYWRQFFEWGMDGTPNPTVQATYEWLQANKPSQRSPVVLNWGDSRLGNLMFADDLSVSGVLDWELATLGDVGFDLGWWLFCDRHHSEGFGVPWPEGLPSRDQTLERWAELSGEAIHDPDWHEAFGGFRFAALMGRAGTMLVQVGALPEGHPMAVSNPATHLLAKLLDVPPPEGESATFLGNQH